MAGVAYGVRLECNLWLGDLPQANTEQSSVRLEIHRTPTLPEIDGLVLNTFRAQAREARLIRNDTFLSLYIESLFRFDFFVEDRLVVCHRRDNVPDELLRYWILQQILPIFLLLTGSVEFLHGTATTVTAARDPRDSCVAFLGPSHAGKSTLLNYFLSQGHTLVTDDHLALRGDGLSEVLPAIPYHRPYRGSEDLGVLVENYSALPRALDRIYMLQPAKPDAPIKKERITGVDAVAALIVDNHYTLHDYRVPRFLSVVEKRFRGLADLSRKIPITRLYVPRAMERLPELYDFILQDLAS